MIKIIKTASNVLRWILLLAFACAEFGCMSQNQSFTTAPVQSVSPTSYPATMSTLTSTPLPVQKLTDTPSQTATLTPCPTPIQTPAHMLSPTPVPTPSHAPDPILEPSVLREITVFYVYSIYTQSVKLGKAEMMSEIWRIQADGSGKQRLFRGDVLEQNWLADLGELVLSHNGQKLAFIQDIDLWQTTIWSSSLWIMNIDGSDAREWVGQLPDYAKPGSANWTVQDESAFNAKPRPESPAWSPDDAQIAFVDKADSSFGQVYILDTKNGQWWWVGAGDVVEWSPEGQVLAIRSNPPAADILAFQIVDAHGQVQTTLDLPSNIVLWELDWSESTKHIVALSQRLYTDKFDIYVIDPYHGYKVAAKDTFVYAPRWSPDGKMIMFARGGQFVRHLYVLNLASGDEKLIMPQVGYAGDWSPDSRFILTQSDVEGNGLYIVSVSDGRYWKIPNTEGASNQAWLFPSQ